MIYLDEYRRGEAIEAGWEAYRDRIPTMRLAYDVTCDSWGVVAVCSGSEVIGALFHKDGVIHLGIVPAWRSRWASKRVIREMLAYGTETTVQPWESDCLSFIGRIGFEKQGTSYVVRR